MSLGHFCTVTCSLVLSFRAHWVETCHCAEFSFSTWLKSFELKHLNWAVFFHWATLGCNWQITVRVSTSALHTADDKHTTCEPTEFWNCSSKRVTERRTARTRSLWNERLAHGDAGTHCRADKLWGLEEHCCKHWLVTCHTGTRKHEWRTVWTEVRYTHSRVTVQLF